MSATSNINAINVTFYAEDAAAADSANGSYNANFASDSRYYQWQGTLQTVPMGMNGDPEGFVAAMRDALPIVNTLRLQFNAYSFNADGSLHEQYERFLDAAVANGFQLLMVYSDGEVQRLGSGDGLTATEILTQLDGPVQARGVAAWQDMMNWMGNHPQVADAVYGYELANEPASYETSVEVTPRGGKGLAEAAAVALYAEHMAELAQVILAQSDAKVLVGGYAYSALFEPMATNNVGDQSALDFLREAIGDQLVWSAHIYPGWHSGADIESADLLPAVFEAAYADVLADDILITETNLVGDAINDFDGAANVVQYFARVQEWFADNGIGVSWFPGVGAGGSSFVTIDSATELRFLHQHSYAFGMNAFSLDDTPADQAGGDFILADLIEGRLRNEVTDPGYTAATAFDRVDYLGTAFGYDGDDTLLGSVDANNFLYGGRGQDRVAGNAHEDFLFGQYGDDALRGFAGNDLLFGGLGQDLVSGGTGHDTLEGGKGLDRFDAREGNDLITDFDRSEGDRIYLGRGYGKWSAVEDKIVFRGINGEDKNDVVIVHADGSRTTLLDARGTLTADSFIFAVDKDVIDGTAGGDRIRMGYLDFDGQTFGTDLHEVEAGAGADTILGSTANDTLSGGAGADDLTGGIGRDVLIGGAGADDLLGDDGNDVLMASDGNDRADGGEGADVLQMGAGNDTAYGGAGNDTISGNGGRDYLYGRDGDDRLHSSNDYARIWGDAGNDTLVANLRQSGHRLTGGIGDDTFVFNDAIKGRTTQSIITDFDRADDRLIFEGRHINLSNLSHGITGRNTDDGYVLKLEAGHTVLLDDFFL